MIKNLNKYKKTWYNKHRKQLMNRQNSRTYKDFRNCRLAIHKLLKKINNMDRVSDNDLRTLKTLIIDKEKLFKLTTKEVK